jgi:AraC family transcriptional regulator
MTNSSKSAFECEPGVLTIKALDQPASRSHDRALSFAQSTRPVDQNARAATEDTRRKTSFHANFDDSGDQVIRSLCVALETVELEYDEPCAEALRQAIAARLAGFRPEIHHFARCREGDDRRSIRALQKWRLKRVIEYVDTNLSSKINLLELAAVSGLSRMHFASQFRVATGLRPHEFLLRRRIRRSEELLRSSQMSIVEIALAVGFQTQAHFTTVFKRFARSTPRQWRTANQISAIRRARNSAGAGTAAAL